MLVRTAFVCWLAFAGTASAQAASIVYRCPGPPVLYTDSISLKEAQDKSCRKIEGGPITIVQGQRPVAASAAEPPRHGETRIDPAQQRSRDGERRRVLETELREAEARQAATQRDYAGGNAERRGDERNYQRYLDRMAELKASIARQESDLQALKREISKLP
jgi:hypothetical protein